MASLFSVHGSNTTTKWETEPATRGTFDLLSTCIITLSLCVWSSVHLNLPGNDQDYWAKFSRRASCIIGALVAPEYLILTAWSQRQMAKEIFKEVKDTVKSKKNADPESQPLSRRHSWMMTHSFWAIMGGIAIDPTDSNPFIPHSKRTTLTPKGVSFLLKHEPQLLPDISEEEVKDRRKGSSFTKFVACIQATWFCLSCIARISQKLPISMLELNTFAHAFCTVIVYALWKKPLDIEQPLLVQEDRMRRLLAYMWMASKTSCIANPTSPEKHTTISGGNDPEFEAIMNDNASGARVSTASGVSNAKETASNSTDPAVYIPSIGAPSVSRPLDVTVTTTQDLPGTGFRVNHESTRWKWSITYRHSISRGREYTRVKDKPAVFNLTPRDVRRWQLAREAMDKYGLKKPDTDLDLVTIDPVPESFMGLSYPDKKPTTWAPLGLSLVAAGHGGLHALAWNAHFPTLLELKLWRISALVIASPAALFVLLILLSYVLVYATGFARFILRFCYRKFAPDQQPKLTQKPQPKPPVVTEKQSSQSTALLANIAISIFGVLVSLAQCLAINAFLLLYIPARGYFVYESFRTVFFLPPEAYRATRWTQYMPHITRR